MDPVVGRLLKDQFNKKSSAACAAAEQPCVAHAAFADPLYRETTACTHINVGP
jgi:hypothetical protein